MIKPNTVGVIELWDKWMLHSVFTCSFLSTVHMNILDFERVPYCWFTISNVPKNVNCIFINILNLICIYTILQYYMYLKMVVLCGYKATWETKTCWRGYRDVLQRLSQDCTIPCTKIGWKTDLPTLKTNLWGPDNAIYAFTGRITEQGGLVQIKQDRGKAKHISGSQSLE